MRTDNLIEMIHHFGEAIRDFQAFVVYYCQYLLSKYVHDWWGYTF